MSDQPEPAHTCRPVEIDGETILVRGAQELGPEGVAALSALVRAAKTQMAADPIPVRQQIRAAAFNAVAPALQQHGERLRLTVRRAVAHAVLEAIEQRLEISEAEAWCKACRRIWDGPRHQCESDAEQRLAQARAEHQQVCPVAQGALVQGFTCSLCQAFDNPAATEATEPRKAQ
ncbi:hypothetical protein ACWERY_02260 [Streptomyces sp. NPDC004082]